MQKDNHEITAFPLAPALVKAINRYLLVSTKIERADLCLLFGGQKSAVARVQKAASLWHDGLIQRIIVSGGLVGNSQSTEADVMSEMLIEEKVPRENILLENHATNTGENVVFSMAVLKREGLFRKIQTVICVGRLSTSRRYLMTLQRYWPSVTKMLAVANYHEVDPLMWHTNRALAEEIVGEWRKLRPYFDAGFIQELDCRTCPLISSP